MTVADPDALVYVEAPAESGLYVALRMSVPSESELGGIEIVAPPLFSVVGAEV